MFNNMFVINMVYLNFFIYVISILTLLNFIQDKLSKNDFLTKKNFLIFSILVFFISGLPLGSVFIAKTQIWLFSQKDTVLFLVLISVLTNTIFLYFYLFTFIRINNLKQNSSHQRKNKQNRIPRIPYIVVSF